MHERECGEQLQKPTVSDVGIDSDGWCPPPLSAFPVREDRFESFAKVERLKTMMAIRDRMDRFYQVNAFACAQRGP